MGLLGGLAAGLGWKGGRATIAVLFRKVSEMVKNWYLLLMITALRTPSIFLLRSSNTGICFDMLETCWKYMRPSLGMEIFGSLYFFCTFAMLLLRRKEIRESERSVGI